ncbi:hypothetical protein Tco_0123660 [Tanacetum coccineum]
MMERELGEGYSFTKKKCFVCGSLSHLIKDCDYYEKKMAREAEVKKQRVFNTGNGVAKPVWTNANRVNHSNKFVPRSVQLNTGRTNINSVRPNINTGRTNVNPVRPRVNTGSSNVNSVRSRKPVPTKTSNSFSPKRPQDPPTEEHGINRDASGITMLPNNEIFEGMGHMGSEHPDVAQSQPSSSTIPVPSTSLPPVQSPPPITTPIPASTPTPIPESDPEPIEHTFEEPYPTHQHFSPRTNQRPRTEVCG